MSSRSTSSSSFTVNSRDAIRAKEMVDKYLEYPEQFRRNLHLLQQEFYEDKHVLAKARDIFHRYRKALKKYPKAQNIVFQLAMIELVSPRYLFDTGLYKHAIAYDRRGNIVLLDSIIVPKKKHGHNEESLHVEHVCVMRGRLITPGKASEKSVVVKWYKSKRCTIQYEIDIYSRLKALGMETPSFSTTFMFWDTPVLVIENLMPLTSEDDENKVGVAVLQQLKTIHKIGIHNDIKPGNVMKRVRPDEETKYFVIDYGGVATDRLKYGYQRWTWTPKWSCQPHIKSGRDEKGQKIKRVKQVTTAKHDFMELGYTMKTLIGLRTGDHEIRTGFTGRLKRYMDYIDKHVDSRNIRPENYDDLIAILNGKD